MADDPRTAVTTVVETDRTVVLPAPPGAAWAVLADVPSYPTFWPWLHPFDGRRLAAGEEWRGTISATGPLRLRIGVRIDEVVPERSVHATLSGDLTGTAHITLDEAVSLLDGATALRLVAALEPRRPGLRALTRFARPVAQASHDRVIDRALAQLAAHLTP